MLTDRPVILPACLKKVTMNKLNYPKDFINKVINGDCLSVMKHIPDGAVDLVLTDPPYGIGESNEKNMSRGTLSTPTDYGHYDWDKSRPNKEVFDYMLSVSKNQIIFGGNYFIDFLYPTPCWVVWDKDNGASGFADCELAWGSFSSSVRKFKWKWLGMLQEKMGKSKEYCSHPTQKPLPLMRWIIEKYSEPDQLILDPFLGSGTTAVACKQLGRRFIGIEINPDYCKIAEDRLRQEELF